MQRREIGQGARVETPHGTGVVKAYEVLKDACVVVLDDERKLDVAIDDCRELDKGPACNH